MAPSDIVSLKAASLVIVPVHLSVQVAVIILVHGLDSPFILVRGAAAAESAQSWKKEKRVVNL